MEPRPEKDPVGEPADLVPRRRLSGGAPLEFMRRWELVLYETSPGRVLQAMESRSKQRAESESSVFLSHSGVDQRLVRAAVNFIASHGVQVFVDWIDGGVPDELPGTLVAQAREAVQSNRKFVFLATSTGLSAPWVPWELGVADGAKGLQHIAILPIEDQEKTFPSSKLLRLYPTIRRFERGWVVVDPDQAGAERLQDWLKS